MFSILRNGTARYSATWYVVRAPARRDLSSKSTTPKPAKSTTPKPSRSPTPKSSKPKSNNFVATTPMAKELAATGIWKSHRGGRPKWKPQEAEVEASLVDHRRVNIVDEKLCDDIVSYLGPTLKRHEGCDLVDINPGVGIWSRKLHEFLKPRSHILMEPDAEFYRSYLEPIIEEPGAKVVPKSGIVWKDLTEVLRHIENQTPLPSRASLRPKRNDTLLVTANLAFFPKKKYSMFDSAAQLVLYQLLHSIRMRQLFQKYGLVRMLIWTGPDDWQTYLPKNLQSRRKGALEAETTCEWLAQVAGPDVVDHTEGWFHRDKWIDVDSTIATLRRMKRQGIEIPEGRKMTATEKAEPYICGRTTYAGNKEISVSRFSRKELEELEKQAAEGKISNKEQPLLWRRLTMLRRLDEKEGAVTEVVSSLMKELDEIREMRRTQPQAKKTIAKREAAWNERVEGLKKNETIDFRLLRDNMHVFQQDPPVLLYDQRPYEPIKIQPTEFFPSVECSLLDIQPKAMHRLHREVGPDSSRAGEMFDMILRALMGASMMPMSKALERVWPGAAEGVLPNCPSLRDPEVGGVASSGHAELCPRVLNQKQWAELLEAFMDWPFRPTYFELIGRLSEDTPSDDNDSAGGSNFSVDAALNI